MLKSLTLATLGAVALALLISSTAQARPPISEDSRIHGELFAVAVGDEIRKRCPSISARMGQVLRRAKALERYALGQGYSKTEIDAYLDSKSDQERYKALRDRWLAQKGARKGDAGSFCRVGEAEIAARSAIGTLLWSR